MRLFTEFILLKNLYFIGIIHNEYFKYRDYLEKNIQ